MSLVTGVDSHFVHLTAEPFDELLKMSENNQWFAMLCEYRTKNYEEFREVSTRICNFIDFSG